MAAVRRGTAIVLGALLVLGWTAPTAQAHGGEVVFAGTIDGFYIEVTDRVVETGDGLLYTIAVRDEQTGLPVDGADVTVTATAGDTRTGPLAATYFGNQYQVLIPDPGVSTWTVRTTIEATTGDTTLEHQIAGTAPNRLGSVIGVALGATGVLVLAVAGGVRRRPGGRSAPLRAQGTGG